MRATLRDIARSVGVDVSTVSKVLQGASIRVSSEKRAQIERVAKELNYRPNVVARGLRLRRSGAVAMPVDTLANYLFPEIINGAEDAAEHLGLVLFLLKRSHLDPLGQLTALFENGRVDGFLFADEMPTRNFAESLKANNIPYVSLNRTETGEGVFVALDDEAGFDAQAEFLAALGHKIVAYIRVSPPSFISRLCEKAFVNGSESRGVSCPESHRLSCTFDGEGCLEVVKALIALQPRPTAIATASVIVAARLVEGLQKQGLRVPEDFSVIGYHDSPVVQWPPPGVTTVRMPSQLQGHRGVTALAQAIEGKPTCGEIIKEMPQVVDRGTCAGPLRA